MPNETEPDLSSPVLETQSEARIELAEVLDMKAAWRLKERLTAILAVGGSCLIDASHVKRVSTGCVQVMAAFFSDMRAAGHAATLRRPSDELMRAFNDLGLSAVTRTWKMEH